jgi:hypothetical protein
MKRLGHVTKYGAAIAECFDDLAALRMEVFRDFPYLYEGSLDYEREYLSTYANSSRSFLYAIYDGQKMVGATTCIPLIDETTEVQAPFVKNQIDLSRIFYFGESILLSPYRGAGLGHTFFDVREAHAASFADYTTTSFCSVERSDSHPRKPADYRSNEVFWRKRGYSPVPELTSFFEWTDIGEKDSSTKAMNYWTKSIR